MNTTAAFRTWPGCSIAQRHDTFNIGLDAFDGCFIGTLQITLHSYFSGQLINHFCARTWLIQFKDATLLYVQERQMNLAAVPANDILFGSTIGAGSVFITWFVDQTPGQLI
jgi:hypothetical protein